jgi:hypothetical protein
MAKISPVCIKAGTAERNPNREIEAAKSKFQEEKHVHDVWRSVRLEGRSMPERRPRHQCPTSRHQARRWHRRPQVLRPHQAQQFLNSRCWVGLAGANLA